jgi:hypothetical protein
MKFVKQHKYILIFCGSFILNSCSSSQSKATPEQLNELTELIQNKNFEISSDMAYPQVTSAMLSVQNSGLIPPGSSINQISLIGNVNYLRIVGDSIYADLPYFGERQMNAGYKGSDTSISINGALQNYEVMKHSQDDSYSISFNTKTQNEVFRFNINLFPNLNTTMIVNGSTRFPIQYSGKVNVLH